MRLLMLSIVCGLLLGQSVHSQTLDDIKKLEQLRKQLEEMGRTPQEIEKIQKAESLTTFSDTLSEIPEISEEKIITPPPAPEADEQAAPFSRLPYFGFDVFSSARLDLKPEIFGPVDRDYPLGPGDELIITVWGEVELRHELIIDREGQIYIPKVGIIKAAGQSLAELIPRLKSTMARSYSSLSNNRAFLDVALGKLRAVQVYVVGDVNNPGTFTVPALTSVFSMLFYAGGVGNSGSLRNIMLVRNDEVIAALDFYDFLRTGKKFPNVRIQNYDVIVVPSAQKRVSLDGAVTKPAIYELKEDEGLIDLIHLAGGLRSNAYVDQLRIERYVENRDQTYLTVNYRELRAQNENFALLNGDRVFADTLNREIENIISVLGPIYGPNRFQYYKGFTIKELFNQVDSIRGDAYLDRVHITRTLPDRTRRIFSINLNDFLRYEEQDFLLAPGDQIIIQSMRTLFPDDSVRIFGAVNRPGIYLLQKDMTLKDLIFSAGGFTRDALITRAEISRIDPANKDTKKLADLIFVPIDSNYTKSLESRDDELFFLEAFDNVFIRSNSDWELQRNVLLSGEVERPGVYTLKSKTERITDLIERAGGLKPTAYLSGARFVRTEGGVGRIGIDFEKIFRNPRSDENIFLQNGDEIEVPEQLHTVKVVGGVNFPSSVLYERGKGLDYYIKAAGGYVELADEKNVTIRLANGRPVLRNRFLLWRYLSDEITAGTTIYVPILVERESIDWSGAIRDAAAILASVATTILIVDRLK